MGCVLLLFFGGREGRSMFVGMPGWQHESGL